MGKQVVRGWHGNDTYGRAVEVAERADGVFFARCYGWNGFGKAWSKWEVWSPDWETRGVNRYTGEEVEYAEPVLYWGFQRMSQFSGTPNFRLPKV